MKSVSTSYETSSSSSARALLLTKSGNAKEFLITYSFFASGFKYCETTLAAWCVCVPVWSTMGRSFRSSNEISSND